jgi:hypothetical protein
MRQQWFLLLVLGCISILWMSGCDKNSSTEATTSDREAISSIVAHDAFFQADVSLLNDGDPTSTPLYSLSKTDAAILPHAWGRKIESFHRDVNFTALTDSTAMATVTVTMQGFVWIRAKYALTDTVVQTIKKSFTETTTRIVKFIRINRSTNALNNWKISEISAIKGGTVGSQITINELRFYTGSDTIIVTDPNNTFLAAERGPRRCIPQLIANLTTPSRVEVTVTSSAPDSDIVSVHRPFWFVNRWLYHAPMALVRSTNNGDGTFTHTYTSIWRGVWAGRQNMIVSAITRNSIFDNDTTQFSSQIWGVPFIVQ